MPINPQYKRVNWTLKIENSDVKLPDFKGWVEVAGSFSAPVSIPAASDFPPDPTVIRLGPPGVPAGFRVVAITLTVDQAAPLPKDAKPLRIYTSKNDANENEPGIQLRAPNPYRELGPDQARASVGYFIAASGYEPPDDNTWYIINENNYEAKLTLSVSYGPSPSYAAGEEEDEETAD
jgi:hypothetical protein